MEKLFIEKTEDTPLIDFCPNSNKLVIEGRSLPEDVTTFYQPVLDWLDKARSASGFDMEIRLEYFNTASSKLLLDILMKIEEIQNSGATSYRIKWLYDSNDTDMQEAAVEYSELIEVPIEIIAI